MNEDKKKYKIAIIGGGGRMGQWFGHLFENDGHLVQYVTGRELEEMSPFVATSDVVIVSVPIGVTCQVIEMIGPYVQESSLLMDLTSIKALPVASMLTYSRSAVIGTHPLFGPDIIGLAGQTVVLCPARAQSWLPWLEQFFTSHGGIVQITSPEKHDKTMALVQAMAHMGTILLGLLLHELDEDLALLEQYSTPLFRVQMGLVGRLFGQDPRVFSEILTHNDETRQCLPVYCALMERLKVWIDKGQADEIVEAMTAASSFFDAKQAPSLATSSALIEVVLNAKGSGKN